MRAIFRRWPLSLFGSMNLAFAILVWTWSASVGNHAGIVLAVFLFAMIALAVCATHFANGARRAADCSWSKNATLYEGENPLALRIMSTARMRLFPLTRTHLSLSGHVTSAGRRLYRVSFECRIPEGDEFDAPLAIPASGLLSLRGGYLVRDALGLSRKRIGPGESLDAAVLPRLGRFVGVRVEESNSSASRNSLDRKNESEKIFVREYAAGDLARDINWKALARTGALLTRIPPESPREERFVRLVIHVPPFTTARGFVELDHVRALASSFLESVRANSGDYGFDIRVNGSTCLVEPGESLDAAKEFLCGLGQAAAGGVGAVSRSMQEDAPEHSWIIGSRSDPALRECLPRYLEAGCDVLLSRFEFFAGAGSHSLPILSSGPRSLALPFLYFAILPVRKKAGAVSVMFSQRVTEFRCGVRP